MNLLTRQNRKEIICRFWHFYKFDGIEGIKQPHMFCGVVFLDIIKSLSWLLNILKFFVMYITSLGLILRMGTQSIKKTFLWWARSNILFCSSKIISYPLISDYIQLDWWARLQGSAAPTNPVPKAYDIKVVANSIVNRITYCVWTKLISAEC